MRFDIVTLFPEFFASPLGATMLQKGQERGALQFRLYNIREFATDKHRVTDDAPYGGGAGMVMKVGPLVSAIEASMANDPLPLRVLLSPQGVRLSQSVALDLAQRDALALVCGRYEGVDERVREFVDLEVSIGDFVLSGGEAAALVLIDVVSRLVPGVLGSGESVREESFAAGLLEYPQYTRPPEYPGHARARCLAVGRSCGDCALAAPHLAGEDRTPPPRSASRRGAECGGARSAGSIDSR